MKIRTFRKHQRGLSLVEMMVGVAVGLIIVAGATFLAASQLTENRQMIVETQVQQDLRSAMDIITRELRRAGSNPTPQFYVWSSATPTANPRPNLLGGLDVTGSGYVVRYGYDRMGALSLRFRYKLTSDGVIQQVIEGTLGNETQDLTDRNTMKVTDFTVTPVYGPVKQLACPKLCSDGTQTCWPTMRTVSADVMIEAMPVAASGARRRLNSTVQLRNDFVNFNVSATQVCP